MGSDLIPRHNSHREEDLNDTERHAIRELLSDGCHDYSQIRFDAVLDLKSDLSSTILPMFDVESSSCKSDTSNCLTGPEDIVRASQAPCGQSGSLRTSTDLNCPLCRSSSSHRSPSRPTKQKSTRSCIRLDRSRASKEDPTPQAQRHLSNQQPPSPSLPIQAEEAASKPSQKDDTLLDWLRVKVQDQAREASSITKPPTGQANGVKTYKRHVVFDAQHGPTIELREEPSKKVVTNKSLPSKRKLLPGDFNEWGTEDVVKTDAQTRYPTKTILPPSSIPDTTLPSIATNSWVKSFTTNTPPWTKTRAIPARAVGEANLHMQCGEEAKISPSHRLNPRATIWDKSEAPQTDGEPTQAPARLNYFFRLDEVQPPEYSLQKESMERLEPETPARKGSDHRGPSREGYTSHRSLSTKRPYPKERTSKSEHTPKDKNTKHPHPKHEVVLHQQQPQHHRKPPASASTTHPDEDQDVLSCTAE